MSRLLVAFLPIPDDHAAAAVRALEDDPVWWLPDARPDGEDRWRVALTAGRWTRDVRCSVGVVRGRPGTVWRDIGWVPLPDPDDTLPLHQVLPTFSGEIGVHRERRVLVLAGTYAVPGGRLGEITDAALLGGVARATADRFLSDVSRRVRGFARLASG